MHFPPFPSQVVYAPSTWTQACFACNNPRHNNKTCTHITSIIMMGGCGVLFVAFRLYSTLLAVDVASLWYFMTALMGVVQHTKRTNLHVCISLYMICVHYVFVVAYEPNQFHAQFRRNWHPWSHHHHLQIQQVFHLKLIPTLYCILCNAREFFAFCFFYIYMYLGSILIFHEKKRNYYLSYGGLCGGSRYGLSSIESCTKLNILCAGKTIFSRRERES